MENVVARELAASHLLLSPLPLSSPPTPSHGLHPGLKRRVWALQALGALLSSLLRPRDGLLVLVDRRLSGAGRKMRREWVFLLSGFVNSSSEVVLDRRHGVLVPRLAGRCLILDPPHSTSLFLFASSCSDPMFLICFYTTCMSGVLLAEPVSQSSQASHPFSTLQPTRS